MIVQFVVNLLINGFAVYATSSLLGGVHISDFSTAVIVSVILGVFNALLKPVLLILTLPITIFTFGLFAIILNGLIILLVSFVVPGFTVDNIWWAVLFSLFLSVINWIIQLITK